MAMAKGSKTAAHHAILEIIRAVESSDPAGVRDHETEVSAFPGNFLLRPDQTRSDSRDGLLTGPLSRGHVQIDASRQIKAAFDRRGDLRYQFDSDHSFSINLRCTSRYSFHTLPHANHRPPHHPPAQFLSHHPVPSHSPYKTSHQMTPLPPPPVFR